MNADKLPVYHTNMFMIGFHMRSNGRYSRNWKPVVLVFLVFMCGQFSGFAVVVNYTVDIFNAANTGIDANLSAIIVGLVR